MKIALYEIGKLFSKKLFSACLVLFLVANVFVLYYTQLNSYTHQLYMDSKAVYAQLRENTENLTQKEAEKFLQKEKEVLQIISSLHTYDDMKTQAEKDMYQFVLDEYKTESPELYKKALKLKDEIAEPFIVLSAIQSIQSDWKYIEDYDSFINEMQTRANEQLTFAIFSKPGTFSYNNIAKTPKDFEKLKSIELRPDNDLALETATTFPLTDFLVVALVILMCISLFAYEREKGLYSLVRSTEKGRFPTIASKIGVILIFTVGISVVYYLSSILCCGAYSGFGDLSRPVQSSEMFMNCSYKLTVLQYLCLWIFGKVAVMCAVALLVALVFVAVKNTAVVFATIGGVMALEYVLYITIDSNALFNHFRYINIFYMLSGNNIFGNYLNLNFFTAPISYTVVFALFVAIVSVVSLVAICLLFVKENQEAKGFAIPFLQKLSKRRKIRGSVKVFSGEAFKHYKGSLVAVALILLVFYGYDNFTTDINIVYQSSAESSYSEYMKTLQGELTPEKEDFLKQEQAYFDDLYKQMKRIKKDKNMSEDEKQGRLLSIETTLNGKGQAFEEIMEQKEYIIETGKKIGEKPVFVNKLIYSRLLQNSPREWEYFTLMLVLVIFSASNLFACEHKKGMANLIRCSRKGKLRLVAIKIGVLFLSATMGYILIYLPYMMNYIKTFPDALFDVPLIFIPEFHLVNSTISIIGMVIVESVVHISVAFAVAMVTVMLSQLLKSNILAMMISSVVAVFPCLLCINAENVRLYTAFLSGQWLWLVPVVVCTMVVVGLIFLVITAISFSKISFRGCKNET